jgi:hypothetical protein
MIIATHGIIASQMSGFDADAQAFFDRVTTAGGSLSATEKTAVNQLVLDMKSYSIWSKMKAIYPMVGASSAACAQNLKSSSFTGTFNGGWTFATTGATPNGSTGYMDTGLNMFSNLSQNNTHIMVYSRTERISATVMIGASNTGFNQGCYIYPRFDANIAYFSIFNGTAGNSTVNITSSRGFIIASRLISTQESYYLNSSILITNTNNTTTPASLNMFIGARNNNGSAANFSDRETASASIGDGLTDTEAGNFYTAVQAFQTTLNRNV